jgi:hypothetical protein
MSNEKHAEWKVYYNSGSGSEIIHILDTRGLHSRLKVESEGYL